MQSRQTAYLVGLAGIALVLGMAGCKKKSASKNAEQEKTEAPAARGAVAVSARGGIGAAARPGATPRHGALNPVRSVARLPTGPVAVAAGGRLTAFKATPWWRLVRDKLSEFAKDPDYKSFVAVCKVDLLQTIDAMDVVFGRHFLQTGKVKEMAIMVHGRFDGQALVKCIATLSSLSDKGVKLSQVAGKPAVSFTDESGDRVTIIGVGKGTLALANSGFVNLAASGDILASSPRIKGLKKTLSRKAIAWVIVGRVPINPKTLGPFAKMLAGVHEIAGAGIALFALGNSWRLVANVDVGSLDAAGKVVKFISLTKGLVAMQAGKLPPGAKPVLDVLQKMKTETVGGNVVITVPLGRKAVDAMMSMAAKELK